MSESENASRQNIPAENPQHASVPEAREHPVSEDREDTPDQTGAIPAPGQDPQDNPDTEGEDRFDAG